MKCVATDVCIRGAHALRASLRPPRASDCAHTSRDRTEWRYGMDNKALSYTTRAQNVDEHAAASTTLFVARRTMRFARPYVCMYLQPFQTSGGAVSRCFFSTRTRVDVSTQQLKRASEDSTAETALSFGTYTKNETKKQGFPEESGGGRKYICVWGGGGKKSSHLE